MPLPSLLIADDDADDLFFARRLLLKAGVTNPVVTVEDGLEAVNYLAGCIETGDIPCLVLLDIKMPKHTGFEVLEWARRQPALGDVGFVIMSGSDLPSDRERARELGVVRYIVKYPTAAELADVVRTHCTMSA